MNSVHLVTQEQYRVKPGQKLSRGALNPNLAQLSTPRCALAAQPAAPRAPACACHAPPRACCRAPRACCRSPSLPRAPPAERSACRAPASSARQLRLAPARPAACNARPRAHARPAPVRSLAPVPSAPAPSAHAPASPAPARPSAHARAVPAHPSACCLAFLSQHKLGSSPSKFLHQKFYIFFFHLFPEIGKIKKISLKTFFFFHNTSNKFIKIYFFSPFPSIFQFVNILENYFLPPFFFSTK